MPSLPASSAATEGIEKVARNMLAKGIDVETIASVTGLTEKVIRGFL